MRLNSNIKRPLLLAHRGFSGLFPENTMRAFMEAIAIDGCDGFESDVHLSADNEPVVIHDPVLDRTTSGKGPVKAHTFKQLRELDIGSWKDPRFAGERMMHLDELLALIIEHDMVLNLEIKNYEVLYPGIEKIVIDRIRAMNAADRVFLSSFNHVSMEICKDVDPGIRTGFLHGYPLLNVEEYAARYRAEALHPRYSCFLFEPDLVDRIHKAGFDVNTWTVNTEEDMRLCIGLGVDSIISNYPDRLAAVLRGEGMAKCD